MKQIINVELKQYLRWVGEGLKNLYKQLEVISYEKNQSQLDNKKSKYTIENTEILKAQTIKAFLFSILKVVPIKFKLNKFLVYGWYLKFIEYLTIEYSIPKNLILVDELSFKIYVEKYLNDYLEFNLFETKEEWVIDSGLEIIHIENTLGVSRKMASLNEASIRSMGQLHFNNFLEKKKEWQYRFVPLFESPSARTETDISNLKLIHGLPVFKTAYQPNKKNQIKINRLNKFVQFIKHNVGLSQEITKKNLASVSVKKNFGGSRFFHSLGSTLCECELNSNKLFNSDWEQFLKQDNPRNYKKTRKKYLPIGKDFNYKKKIMVWDIFKETILAKLVELGYSYLKEKKNINYHQFSFSNYLYFLNLFSRQQKYYLNKISCNTAMFLDDMIEHLVDGGQTQLSYEVIQNRIRNYFEIISPIEPVLTDTQLNKITDFYLNLIKVTEIIRINQQIRERCLKKKIVLNYSSFELRNNFILFLSGIKPYGEIDMEYLEIFFILSRVFQNKLDTDRHKEIKIFKSQDFIMESQYIETLEFFMQNAKKIESRLDSHKFTESLFSLNINFKDQGIQNGFLAIHSAIDVVVTFLKQFRVLDKEINGDLKKQNLGFGEVKTITISVKKVYCKFIPPFGEGSLEYCDLNIVNKMDFKPNDTNEINILFRFIDGLLDFCDCRTEKAFSPNGEPKLSRKLFTTPESEGNKKKSNKAYESPYKGYYLLKGISRVRFTLEFKNDVKKLNNKIDALFQRIILNSMLDPESINQYIRMDFIEKTELALDSIIKVYKKTSCRFNDNEIKHDEVDQSKIHDEIDQSQTE